MLASLWRRCGTRGDDTVDDGAPRDQAAQWARAAQQYARPTHDPRTHYRALMAINREVRG